MAKFRVQSLGNRWFKVDESRPPVLQGAQLRSALAALSGKRIFLDYERTIEGAETASRLIRETLTSHGASFVPAISEADCALWIGATSGHFTFVVMDARNHSNYRCHLSGPSELTAAIMTTLTTSMTTDDLELLDATNVSDRRRAEDDLIALGGRSIDSLLQSVAQINARLLGGEDPERNMAALERRINVLGRLRDERGVRAIVDALADAAGTLDVLDRQITHTGEHGLHHYDVVLLASGRHTVAESLCEAAVGALVEIGAPALSIIDRSIPKASPSAQKALRRAEKKIRGRWWEFWRK